MGNTCGSDGHYSIGPIRSLKTGAYMGRVSAISGYLISAKLVRFVNIAVGRKWPKLMAASLHPWHRRVVPPAEGRA